MGELGALFNPGMRHELQERQAKAARREEEGNARDGDLRIDLESGVAVINVPAGDGDEGQAGDDPVIGSAERSESAQPGNSGSTPAVPAATERAEPDPDAGGEAPAIAATLPQRQDPAALRPRGKRGLSASQR